jgi:hypothetical protein
MFSVVISSTRKSTFCIAASVGPFAPPKFGIAAVPIGGAAAGAGAVSGTTGPFTQQQAGRSRRDRRIVVVVVTRAIGFQGRGPRMRS